METKIKQDKAQTRIHPRMRDSRDRKKTRFYGWILDRRHYCWPYSYLWVDFPERLCSISEKSNAESGRANDHNYCFNGKHTECVIKCHFFRCFFLYWRYRESAKRNCSKKPKQGLINRKMIELTVNGDGKKRSYGCWEYTAIAYWGRVSFIEARNWTIEGYWLEIFGK